ncbi:hypothetical protein EV697_101196 [Bisgaardia hudsonensis]|uniref:DUF535 domain-containing protein n=1 Tax=Bisgaardia hudsonensis TaxID=109472 RepID=A0A4R2N2H9_9PAST|nr:VirK/YbjX family protein [Bisgaardia hudsonensis]QLB12528.1 hypothetical protein A6A11_02375 [Bisgaardia hudsonensis]TCP14068.1 hypothetical protein EV697_101196 [Bisgaardia hudsonensis]
MNDKFLFPSYKQLIPYDKRFLKRVRSFLRFQLYRRWCYSECLQFEDYLNQNPFWQPLFYQNLYRCNTLLEKFCDKRFNKKQRLQGILSNLSLAERILGKSLIQRLFDEDSLLIGKLTDTLSLYLNINQIDPFEGFFSINIKNQNNESIYDASFIFIQPYSILITSVQGPNKLDAQGLVKDTTKQLHGIRPMFMLVYAFQMIAHCLDCELFGIKHKYQAKYRWNDHAKLLFNYDEFWKENKAILNTQDYWVLPLAIEYKSLDDIASKKRSMYRRRYEMLDKLRDEIILFFRGKCDE